MKEDNQYLNLLKANLADEFDKRHDRTIDATYDGREERNVFAAKLIGSKGPCRVLNIGGGGERHLEKHLGQKYEVYEIDLAGDCDALINLDEINSLPFKDEEFDIVCAFDVLEHLENFHLILDEIFRVAKKEVLVSLPNSAYEIIPNVVRNRPQKRPDEDRGTYSKYYGLPLVSPRDRHRWWLYFGDIIRYFVWFECGKSCSINFYTPKLSISQKLVSLVLGKHIYYSFFVPHFWMSIKK